MRFTLITLTCLMLSAPAFAQDAQLDEVSRRASDLEAQVNQLLDTSPDAAKAMIELVDLYHKHGRVFGLVRTGERFINAHPTHPQHKEIMLKLIDGLVATSRNQQLVATARQFASRYPDDAATEGVQRTLARMLERDNKKREAAVVYEAIWTRLGVKARDAGARAVAINGELNNREGFEAAARIAADMVEKLPKGTFADEVAWQGFHHFRRYGEYAGSNQLGNRMIAKGLPLSKERQALLHSYMGENYWNLGQRANAVISMAKSRAIEDNPARHRAHLDYLSGSQAKPEEVKPVADDYAKKYPDQAGYAKIILAYAYQNAQQTPQALDTMAQAIQQDAISHDAAIRIVEWVGNEPANFTRAEQILTAALAKNTDEGSQNRIRYALALPLYRDRIKDVGKARHMCMELLTKSPDNAGYTWYCLSYLLDSAPDEPTFVRDLNAVMQATVEYHDLSNYRQWVGSWIKEARRNKDLKDRSQRAQTEAEKFWNDPFRKLVATAFTDKGQATVAARAELLGSAYYGKLTDRMAWHILGGQAYYTRHYTNKQREDAVELYSRLARRFPTREDAAYWWAESAYQYGKEADMKAATEHALKLPPTRNQDLWLYAIADANKAKDAPLAKRAFAWIMAGQKLAPTFNPGQGHEIGEHIYNAGLKDEGVAYLRQVITTSPSDWFAYSSAERLVAKLEDDAKVATIRDLAKIDCDYHGAYAAWLADAQLKAGDFAAAEKTLRDSKTRQAERPFRGWGMNEYPAQYWVDETRRAESKWTPEQKRQVLTVVRDMEIWRASGAAQAALLVMEDELKVANAPTGTARLLGFRGAVDFVGNGGYDWDRIYPYAQAALAAKDYEGAATLATALLNNVTQVDKDRLDNARNMIGQSYARMGGVGLTIDENSPVAPLLKAALYLRLGDRKLALDTYDANRKLFDENRDALPVDLIEFVAETHIAAGGDENHDRAEDILRSWLLKNSEKPNIEDEVKAQIELLLARNYFKAGRYEVARSEFTTVKNRFPKTKQAVEADFGIGESFMAQKIYDKAEEVFEALANSRERDVVIRAEFLRGVLANRRGDRDQARDIFRSVLERVPDIELANQTLYNLAEVYGVEQRYMDQLELLRTVGRLGRASKRWHSPGTPLSIVVQDSDLGISRGHTKIPVKITTQPGNDEETVYLVSGGAGKGLFRADIDTRLGSVSKNDNVLEITGNDVITVDYPDEFKQQFRSVPLADAEIRIASDAKFDVASSKIVDVEEETFSQKLEREQQEAADDQDKRQSQKRPANQIKPGNIVYMRVKDADRDLSDEPDELIVKLVASSGDQVQVKLAETGPHTGVFEATANTDELPAGALASDNAIDHSPLMAIDQDVKTFWQSVPDGATPKSLTVDMKDLKPVSRVSLWTPDPASKAPVRGKLQGSHDGRFWFTLATNPSRPPVEAVNVEPAKTGTMTQRVYDLGKGLGDFSDWQKIVELTKAGKSTGEWDAGVETLSWSLPSDHDNAKGPRAYAVVWSGKFLQPRDGAARFNVSGAVSAVVVDGELELPPAKAGGGAGTVDVWLTQGLHDLTIFAATANPSQGVSATRARENVNVAQVTLSPFRAADFDQEAPEAKVHAAADADASSDAQPATNIKPISLGLDTVKLTVPSGEFRVHDQENIKRLGYWQGLDQTAAWQFDAAQPGLYDVWIDYANQNSGNAYTVTIGDQVLTQTVVATGGWNNFQQIKIGTVRVTKAGQYSITFKPTKIEGGGLMDLKGVTLKPATGSVITTPDGMWEFRFKQHELRFVRLVVDEYLGEAVAINHVEVAGTGKGGAAQTHIPTSADVLALASNNVLEIAAGDTVTASYTDEFTAFGVQRNRLLTRDLLATYFNGSVEPIAFDFSRTGGGGVQQVRKELMRIDPGERITIEVTDYDMDATDQRDTVKIEILVNDGKPLELVATETEPYSGVFRTEVDTEVIQPPAPVPAAGNTPGATPADPTRTPAATTPAAPKPAQPAAANGNGDAKPENPDIPKIKVVAGDRVYLRYRDQQNTFPGHTVVREAVVFGNEPTEGNTRIVETRLIKPSRDSAAARNPNIKPTAVFLPPRGVDVAGVAFEVPLTVEVIDPDQAKDSRSSVVVKLKTTDGAEVDVRCVISSQYAPQGDIPLDVRNWALLEGRFVGQVIMQLGSKASATTVPRTDEMPRNLIGGPVLTEEEQASGDAAIVARVLNLTGKDRIESTYDDAKRPSGEALAHHHKARLIADGELRVVDREYDKDVEYVHVGEKLFLMVTDADLDGSDERDKAKVRITTERGEDETVELEETLTHSGVFTGSFDLKPREKPTPGNFGAGAPEVESFFGDKLAISYVDQIASTEAGTLEYKLEIPVAIGTNGLVAAFSKVFGNEQLAVQTQFHISESYFELFKSHNKLGREDESKHDLEAGRRVLREVMEDYPDPKYAPRVAYLLGQFAQELKQWDEAIDAYRTIVRQYPDHTLAADAQYKMAQCHEEAGEFEEALEAYVTLAATYPQSPLIANVMIRINEHFYNDKNYAVAAQVGIKFLEKFENHQWASRMAFRVGQCYYKDEQYAKAADAFDDFVKKFPDDALASDALFWSGEAFRMGNNVPLAFRRYNRCRWDYPASEAAKYARGRLALPEMLAQFEREANLEQ